MSQKKKALPHNSPLLGNTAGQKSVASMGQATAMNKSASGSSLVTAGAAPSTASASAIDQVKLERIMAMFGQMSKSDNLCSMILIVMQELRSLIPAASIAFFVVNDTHSKDLQDLETLS